MSIECGRITHCSLLAHELGLFNGGLFFPLNKLLGSFELFLALLLLFIANDLDNGLSDESDLFHESEEVVYFDVT